MTNKNLTVLGVVAVALGVAAYFASGAKSSRQPALNGRMMLPEFAIADVAAVEIGDKVRLAAGVDGWVIETMQGYPADVAKIRENLIRLRELKVGQVVGGKELTQKLSVTIKDATGKEIASAVLGERHAKWGHGRYAEFAGKTVLVADMLDAFGDDPKVWCDAKIIDEPYVSFSAIADPTLGEEVFGFSTGVVAKVTIAGDTNRVATVGATTKDSSNRYLKLDNCKWIYEVPSWSVEKLLPKPEKEETDKSGETEEK